MGLEPVVIPLFEVAPMAWQPPDPNVFDAVAMTSANAARYGGVDLERYKHLRVFAVGEATAQAARSAGFTAVQAGAGTAADLGTILKMPFAFQAEGNDACDPVTSVLRDVSRPESARDGPRPRILHLAGADHKQIPTTAEVTVVPVYTTHRLKIPDGLKADVALIHSPRAGARLAELIADRAAIQIIAISEMAAQASGSGWAATHIALATREHAMLECLRGLCEVSSRN